MLHICVTSDSPAGVLSQELMTPLDSNPAASQGTTDQASAALSTCLEHLPQSILVGLCQAGAARRMPLTVALVSERARHQAAALDSLAWRDLVAGTLALRDLLWMFGCTACCFLALALSGSFTMPCRILMMYASKCAEFVQPLQSSVNVLCSACYSLWSIRTIVKSPSLQLLQEPISMLLRLLCTYTLHRIW